VARDTPCCSASGHSEAMNWVNPASAAPAGCEAVVASSGKQNATKAPMRAARFTRRSDRVGARCGHPLDPAGSQTGILVFENAQALIDLANIISHIVNRPTN